MKYNSYTLPKKYNNLNKVCFGNTEIDLGIITSWHTSETDPNPAIHQHCLNLG